MVVRDLDSGLKGGRYVRLVEYDLDSPPGSGMNFIGAKISDIGGEHSQR